ncbi:response regulator [Geobacter pickeringii]|uniref:LuxR family transcriptional regulator n=1 Tax=Geobacter pickeringii TaxID=345632 RepID=A0A0B5BCG7_9BACT|nr:response regulator transcription factor [Geobacter pickeringii]AJE02769.1 LuxR family transcriptional regulator [Geobacter pickeringii]
MGLLRRILIADDHAIFREGLKQVLAKTLNPATVDEADTAQDVLERIKAQDYDLLLLDISMPGRSGLEVLAEVKALKPTLPVLVLSMHPEEQYALRAFRLGAAGYVTKGSPSRELMKALDRLSLGKKYISPTVAECLVTSLESPSNKPLHTLLSNREFQVLCFIAAGKTVGKIADELCLSVKTISTHRSHILRKMNMRNNAELTRYALEHRLA